MKLKSILAILATSLILLYVVHVPSSLGGELVGTKYDTQAPIWSLGSADFDGDEKEEIVLGSIGHHIFVVDGEGRALWQFDVRGLALDMAISDLSADGKRDIILASQDKEGALYALRYKEGILWKYSGEHPFLSVAVGDIDGDGKQEVIGGGIGGTLYVLTQKGELKWKKRIAMGGSIGAVAVSDIVGDKRLEIVCGTRKQGLFALDSNGNTLWRIHDRLATEKAPRHWIRSVVIDDIDQDGRNEVLMGSRPSGMVTVINGDGEIVWSKNFPKIINKSSNTAIAVGNFTGDKKKEIVCLLQGIVLGGQKGTTPIIILDHRGNTVLESFPKKSFFSLSIGLPDDRGYSRIMLSSPTRGSYFYTLGMEGGERATWQQLAVRDLDNLDAIAKTVNRREIQDKKINRSPKKIHILYPYKADLNKAAVENLMGFLKKMESSDLRFELMITHMYERKRNIRDKRKRPKWVERRGRKSQEEILEIIRLYESLKIPFYLLIGKGSAFHMQLDTMDMILKTAPTFCKGFIVNEDDYTKPKFMNYHQDIVKILDMLLVHGKKKLIMDEYLDYWAKVPTMTTIGGKLFSGKYKDVLIPMYKSNRGLVPEQNIGMIMGLWKAGLVEEWGFCANDDLWKWESIFMNPPHDVILRMEVMAASLGATYFRIEANREFIEQVGQKWIVSEGAKRHRYLFHNMVRKGIIRPVRSRQQVIISSVILLSNDNKTLWQEKHESPDTYWQNVYTRKGPLSYGFPLQVVQNDYVPAYVYEMTHFYDGLFPKTPYGNTVMVPGWLNPIKIAEAKDFFRIDGVYVFDKNGTRYTSSDVKGKLLQALQKHATELPFRADGVFLAINKLTDRYLLYLINPGHLVTSDTYTTLKTNLPLENPRAIDSISGEILIFKDKRVKIKIPAGTFRILQVVDLTKP